MCVCVYAASLQNRIWFKGVFLYRRALSICLSPTDVKQLKRILKLITYLSDFLSWPGSGMAHNAALSWGYTALFCSSFPRQVIVYLFLILSLVRPKQAIFALQIIGKADVKS